MRIKGIYHCPEIQYTLAKQLGFSHVQILNDSQLYPTYEIMKNRIKKAHDVGLNCFIDPHLFVDFDKGMDFLNEIEYSIEDIIYLIDEPNLKDVKPEIVLEANNLVNNFMDKKEYLWRTFISLSPIRSFNKYEEVSDLIGISYYLGFKEGLWRLSLPKLIYKLLWLERSKVIGIPAIKFDIKHLENQVKFWELMGIRDLMWYSWAPDQENPPWLNQNLTNLYQFRDKFMEING